MPFDCPAAGAGCWWESSPCTAWCLQFQEAAPAGLQSSLVERFPALQHSFPNSGWCSGPASFCRAPSHSSLLCFLLSLLRVTAATTSCPLKRRSVCSSWRRPLAHWTLRLTVDCPLTSLNKPQLPKVPTHCPKSSLLPRVRETVWGSTSVKPQKSEHPSVHFLLWLLFTLRAPGRRKNDHSPLHSPG